MECRGEVKVKCYLKILLQFSDMVQTPEVFKENFRMFPSQFDLLYSLLESKLCAKTETRPDDRITAKEKLAVTLE